MINLKQELESFPPIDLKKLEEKETNIPDNIKNSIILYNKALENIATKSEDIAIIELKKAIAMNPDFHEAMNLLGICYSYVGEDDKSMEMFNKVISAESNSIRALEYMERFNAAEESPYSMGKKTKKKKVKAEKEGINKNKRVRPSKPFQLTDISKYIISFTVGALIVFLFSLPFYFGNSEEDQKVFVENNDDSYKEQYQELNKEYDALKSELDTANTEKDTYKAASDYYKNVIQLFQVDGLVKDKEYQAAADKLMDLKSEPFREEDKKKFDSLHEEVMPAAVKEVYNEGKKLFDTRKYEQAIEKLKKIEAYGDQWGYMDASLYYAAMCYEKLSDYKRATELFQKVKQDYPTSPYARYAQNRLNIISAP